MTADVAVFHPGVQHSWQTALALQQLNRLSFYATSIFHQPERWPYRVERYLPPSIARRVGAEFRRFSGPPLDPANIETFGLAEWIERLARRAGWQEVARRVDGWGNRRFARGMSRRIAARNPAILWGYNGSSLETFADSRHAGRIRILDRTIGDWRSYNAEMDAIYDRYREFFPAADYHVSSMQIERDDKEYAAADVILTGSQFAADTVMRQARVSGVADRVRVLHYGIDEALFGCLPPTSALSHDGPIRFLMLGQVNVRKGIHLVLETFARLPRNAATLTIVGHLQIPTVVFERYRDRVDYRPTIARGDVPALLASNDVLLFPSYFEGAGLVLYEALAAGCAVIQSRNAARAVTSATGIMLEQLTEEALYDAVMTVIEDRTLLEGFRHAAQNSAARYGFAAYRDRIASLLSSLA